MKDDKFDTIEQMMATWQTHSQHVERLAQRQDLASIKPRPIKHTLADRRRRILSAVATALACVVVAVAIFLLRDIFVVDTIDLAFILLLDTLLILSACRSLQCALSYQLRRQASPCFSAHAPKAMSLAVPHTVVLAALAAMIIFGAFPVHNDLAFSSTNRAQCAHVMSMVDFFLSNV